MDVLKSTDDELNIDFHYCPLVKAWQKAGCTDEEIACLLQDRREHVREVIEPALQAGKWVLLDRYYLSMMAYQGASGANVEEIREWNEAFATVPDVALWLDIPIELSQERMHARGNGKDAFENEKFLSDCAANKYSTVLRNIPFAGNFI